jgi:hypothetical protein
MDVSAINVNYKKLVNWANAVLFFDSYWTDHSHVYQKF